MRKQCKLLGVARSSVAYQAVADNPEDIRIKRLLDEIYMVDPCLGSRRRAGREKHRRWQMRYDSNPPPSTRTVGPLP